MSDLEIRKNDCNRDLKPPNKLPLRIDYDDDDVYYHLFN